ncbi:alpha/beta hydrolase [Catenulispora yoronensis]|uniref:Alpha/beta hydrolase n=1 Tax=Catenulispora yoronensis TaxID=450799 RepID=A0ABN2V6M7_9ACTN
MATPQSRVPKLIDVAAPGQSSQGEVRAVVLVLPGGSVKSTGRHLTMAEWGLRPLLSQLAAAATPEGIAVHMLRYRMRGWNGEAADPLADTRWALDRLREQHGPVPVLLVGNSLGGRAAFRAADDPRVVGVVGIAPWLPAGEPVEHLAGREVLIVHGDKDHSEASGEKSLEFAVRARAVVPELARVEIPGAGHFLLKGAKDGFQLCTEFAMNVLAVGNRRELLETARGGDLRTVLPIPFVASFAGVAS